MTGQVPPAGSGPVTVREATAADVDGIVNQLEEVAAEPGLIGGEAPIDRGAYRARMAQHIERADHLLLVADVSGRVVGHLSLGVAPYGTADLGMALSPEWRGKGLGRRMLETAIRWARDVGAMKVALEVWPGNTRARALYVRLGFVEEGTKRRHYRRRNGEQWDSVLMGLALDRPSWTVRAVTDEDGWDLIALIGACWAEYPGCIMDAHGECPELLAPASAFAAKAGAMWVVEGPSGEVVACVGLVPHDEGVVELQKLYVARRWRRRGLGAHLIRLWEQEAQRHGATTFELWSDTRFLDAHRVYSAHGYRATGRTRALHDLSETVEAHFEKAVAPGGRS